MSELEHPLRCAACGAPVDGDTFPPGAACARCGRDLVGAAGDAERAIQRLRGAVDAEPALPPTLSQALRGTLDAASARMAHAIAAGAAPTPEPVATPESTAEPVVRTPPAEPQPEPAFEAPEPPPTAVVVTPPAAEPIPVEPAAPTLWQRLGPAFAENLLFLLGGFLLLAGGAYFVSTAWTTMTGGSRLLAVEGGLLVLAGALLGGGYLLNRDRALPDLEAVLRAVAGSLVPLAAIPVGRLAAQEPAFAAAAGALWLLVGAGILRWGRQPLLGALAMGGCTIAAPALGAWPIAAATGIALAAALVVRGPLRTLAPALVGVVAAAAHLAIGAQSPAVVGVVLAGLGVALARRTQGLDLIGLALCVAAPALTFLHPVAALSAAAIGCVGAAWVGTRRDRGLLLLPALVLSLLAYILSPAPIRELVAQLRDQAAAGLGYGARPLPLSWYGVTCLPYVLLGGIAARRLVRFGRDRAARATRQWVLLVAAALCALSLLGGVDLRAPMAVLPAEGLVLLGLGWWLRDRLLLGGGVIALLVTPSLAAATFGWPPTVGLIGVAALGALFRWRLPGAALVGTIGIHIAIGVFLLLSIKRPGALTAWDLVAGPVFVAAAWRLPLGRAMALVALATAGPALGLWAPPIFAALAPFALAGVFLLAWRRLGAPALDHTTAWALALMTASALVQTPDGPASAAAALAAAALLLTAAWWARAPLMAAIVPPLALWASLLFGVHVLDSAATLALVPAVLALLAGAERWATRRLSATRQRLGTGPAWSIAVLGVVGCGLLTLAAIFEIETGRTAAGALALAAAGLLASRDGPARRVLAMFSTVAGLLIAGQIIVHPWPAALVGLPCAALALLLRAAGTWRPGWMPAGQTNWRTLVALFAAVSLALTATHVPAAPWALLPLAVAFLAVARLPGVLAHALGLVAAVGAVGLPLASGLAGVPEPWLPLIMLATLAGASQIARRWPIWMSVPVATAGLALGLIGCAIVWGPNLVQIVLIGPVADAPLALGLGWLVWGLALTRLPLPGKATLCLGLMPALMWWAPISTALGVLPQADVDLGVWALVWVLIDRKHALPQSLVALTALVLTAGTLSDPSALFTLIALTTATAIAALRHRGSVLGDLAVWAAVVTAAVGLVWFSEQRLLAHTNQPLLALICAAGAALAALCRRSAWTLYCLGAIALVVTELGANGSSVLAAGLVAFAVGWRARVGATDDGIMAGALGALTLLLGIAWTCGYSLFEPRMLALSAGVLATFGAAAHRWRGDSAARAALAAGFAGWAVVLLGILALRPQDLGVAALLLPMGLVVSLFAWARRPDIPTVHGLVLASMLVHWILAQSTPWLALLDGQHLHVWAALALAALALRRRVDVGLQPTLLGYALCLPALPLLALDGPASLSATTFLAAVVYGLAARELDNRGLRWGALALANVGACALWFQLGIPDAAFYGLPPGLTLIAASELERSRLPVGTRLSLFIGGLALAYGSVAAQVVIAGSGLHALILLVLGLIGVAIGWRTRRPDLLLGGAAAVVVDVVCYLARNGFQQDFMGAGLLLVAGATVLAAATAAARLRRVGT